MEDAAAMETSALANLLAVRERMKEKKIGALKSAKLNTSIAAKIKTKIINNSSILKISLKHNNKALAMALTAEKEKCRRLETERMYLQKEVKMVHFHNAVLRQNLNVVNKTLREIELFLNLNLRTAIEVSANNEYSADFLPGSTSQRNSECLSRSSEISLDDDCTVRCTAVPLRVPYKEADAKLCQDNNSESTKKISLFPPGGPKLSNTSKVSVESSNTEAAFAVNNPRVSFKCIEQGSEDALVPSLDCVQSDCPSADIKRSFGGSGYVTKRRKRSTMSLSSNQSLGVALDQENSLPILSNSFSEMNDHYERNEQADTKRTSCRESSSLKQGYDQKKINVVDDLQGKVYAHLQPQQTESGAEMDVTASDAGMIAKINTDFKGNLEESDKCDRVSLRKVRYSCNEKKLKNSQKSCFDHIEKKFRGTNTKLKEVCEDGQQFEPQIESMTLVNSWTLPTEPQFETNAKQWNRDHHNDCRRTYVVNLNQVKQEQNESSEKESKETEQNVCTNSKVLENLCKNQNSLGMEVPLESCTNSILSFEESHRNPKSPILQKTLCRTAGKKGKSKVSKKNCEKDLFESCNNGVLRQKDNEILNEPVFQQVSHSISTKKQNLDKNSCDKVALSENCTVKLPFHVIQKEEIAKTENAVCENSQILEHLIKNKAREYPLEANIVNGSLFTEIKDTSNMQTLKLKHVNVSEKHKQNVSKKPSLINMPSDVLADIITFEGSQELQNPPIVREKPNKAIPKTKQKASKKKHEMQNALANCSATAWRIGESNEIFNMPTYQERDSLLIPEKKHKADNESSERSDFPLESCTTKTRSSAGTNRALEEPSGIIEKRREVRKNSYDGTGAAIENYFAKMSFGEYQGVLDMPRLQDHASLIIEKRKMQRESINGEGELLFGNKSTKMLSGDESNVTDFQEQPVSLPEKSKPRGNRNTCESSAAPSVIYSLMLPPSEVSLEISTMMPLPERSCSVIEEKTKCVLKNTHGCLDNFTNLSSVECQVTALLEKPSDVPEGKGTLKVNKGICEKTLTILPFGKKNISNIPACINESKAVSEGEQKRPRKNYETNFESSEEDHALNSKCLKKEKAGRRESKAKKKQNSRIGTEPCDESDQHSQSDEYKTCDQYTKPDKLKSNKRIYRVSFASSKSTTAKLRRETYVVGGPESEEFSSIEPFMHNENVKDRRGTYVVRAPQSEVGLGLSLKVENEQSRRGTYFVRPLNDKASPFSSGSVLSEDLAVSICEDNVYFSDCTIPSVLPDQVTKSRRCTYVVGGSDASDCNVLRNSTCILSESLKNNPAHVGHKSVAKLNNTSSKLSESSECSDQVLAKKICSRNIGSICNTLPVTEDDVPLAEEYADGNIQDIKTPVHNIAANSKSKYKKIDFKDVFDVKTEQFMVDMISDSILVDSTADCPSVLEFSNITAHENMPFTPRKSSDGLALMELIPCEEHHLETFDSLRNFEIPEEINHEEKHNENLCLNIQAALNKAPRVRMETPRKTNKALQDLTNIGDSSSNPSPKTCIKLEEQSSPLHRRRRAPVNYAEPKLRCKLRRGDQHTNTEFLSSPIFKGTKKTSRKTRAKKATVKSSLSV